MNISGGNSYGLLRIRILDVGQGDAIVAILPGGDRALVVDAYDGYRVSQVLDEEGIREVALFLSHSDRDHIYGVPDLVSNVGNMGVRIVAFFFNADRLADKVRSEYVTNLRFLARATRGGVQPWSDTFDTGLIHDDRFPSIAPNPVSLTVLHPTHSERISLLGTSTNEASGVLRIAYAHDDGSEASVLLTGDVQLTGMSCMLHNHADAPGVLRADVLKFPHHGAWPSAYDGWTQFAGRKKRSVADFLAAVDPRTVVISVGRQNGHDHVKREVFEALREARGAGGRLSRIVCTQFTDTCLNGDTDCQLTACAGDIEVRMGAGVPNGIEVLPPLDDHCASILAATTKDKAGCGRLLP